MPFTLKELKNRPTIFDGLKGKTVPEVIEYVVFTAYKGITGRDPTIYTWIGKGTPPAPIENDTSHPK